MKPTDWQSETINVAQAARLKIQTNCAASISIFLIDKFYWANVVGFLWVTNQTTGLYKHPQWWYCHSSPIRSSKLNNSWRPVPSQGFLLSFDVCSLKKNQTSKHLSAHTTAATCIFDVPVCEAACRTFREQKREMNSIAALGGNVHGCKWTASFDDVVQLESQDYNAVLQGDMKSPNTFASCGLRVCHQQHSVGHGKHANIANN